MITHKEVLEYFKYDRGKLIWLKVPKHASKSLVGKEAGSYTAQGYLSVTVEQVRYLLHRLVWFYHHEFWPDNDIDHINGIRDDNRIENLREATRQQNLFNSISKGGSSKYKGVSWDKGRNKWVAQYTLNRKHFYIGRFNTEEDAHEAYKLKINTIHKEFSEHKRYE